MEKSLNIKILFFLSLLATFFLILIALKKQINETSLEELNNLTISSEGEKIVTSGIISQIVYNQNYQKIYLKNCSIQFTAITKNLLNLSPNQKVKIIGKLDQYNNQTQVIINKISILN